MCIDLNLAAIYISAGKRSLDGHKNWKKRGYEMKPECISLRATFFTRLMFFAVRSSD